MEPLSYLALTGQVFDYPRSALPDAPVVECTQRSRRPQRAGAVRSVIASSLYRLGDAVAPRSAPPAEPLAA